MSVTVKEVLTEARRLLNDVGLCKGVLKYVGADGHVLAYCSMGAIDAAVTRLTESVGDTYTLCSQAIKAVQVAIGGVSGGVSIPTWNDTPELTKSDVLSAFSKAIDSCN